MDMLFQGSFLTVAVFWGLLLLAPWWSGTEKLMKSIWVVVPAALLYAVLVLPMFATAMPALMNPKLATIQKMLGTPMGATVAWVHFLAFDFFVARWCYLDSREHGIAWFWMPPILFFVLMLGPFGLLLYIARRWFAVRGANRIS